RGRSTRRCCACSSGAGSPPPGARRTTTARRSSTRSPAPDGDSWPARPKTGIASPASSAGCCGSPSGDAVLTRLLVAVSRVRALFDRRRLDDDFEAEVAAHLAMLTDENVRRRMPPDAAGGAAAVRFGGRQQLVERQREARGLPFVETTLRDLQYAWRSLRRNPAFAAVSILTLAIGIAAATAMFTVAHAVLLRPLPFPEPD